MSRQSTCTQCDLAHRDPRYLIELLPSSGFCDNQFMHAAHAPTRSLVSPASQQTLVILLWIAAIAAGPLLAALGRVWIRQQNVSLGYQLHHAEQRNESLRTELQRLEVARAGGRTPQRVAAMASRLGLGPVQAHQILPLRVRVLRSPQSVPR